MDDLFLTSEKAVFINLLGGKGFIQFNAFWNTGLGVLYESWEKWTTGYGPDKSGRYEFFDNKGMKTHSLLIDFSAIEYISSTVGYDSNPTTVRPKHASTNDMVVVPYSRDDICASFLPEHPYIICASNDSQANQLLNEFAIYLRDKSAYQEKPDIRYNCYSTDKQQAISLSIKIKRIEAILVMY